MNTMVSIILLIVLAIISQHIVAWAGSILHEVGNTESTYAVFTFRDDRNLPMTTNILMNICIPNVFMVFIYMFLPAWSREVVENYLMIYILSFYVYRMLLICIILRRKEMYSPAYELSTAFVGCALALVLNNYFFTSVENVFIDIDELKEELWFAILVVLYQFVKQLLDKRVSQDNVLTKGQISRYIINKFNKFYKRYNDMMDITANTRDMYIFLYSIMIFEDYNRGPIKRFFERIKVHLGNEATVGIMQVKSDKPLSDEESIIEFIKWIEDRLETESICLDEMEIHYLAWEYNNDDAYAKSVAYIYNCLYEYIDDVPKYRKVFYMRENENVLEQDNIESDEGAEKVSVQRFHKVTCDDTKGLIIALINNSYISIALNTYDLLENIEDINNVEVGAVYDGKELIIRDINNVFIKGNGSELVVKPRYATVLTFVDCHDIDLEDMKIGHTLAGECSGAVLRFVNCSNIRLKNLELYGCGTYAINAQDSNLYVENCKIHSCTDGALELYGTKCVLDNVEIFDCKDTWSSIISSYESNIIISDSVIRNCCSKEYIIEIHDTVIIPSNIDVEQCKGEKGISNCELEIFTSNS